MQHPLHIAYAADDAYLTPTAVSLGSAVEACRNRAELAFDILDTGIGDDRWRSFESLLRDRLGDAFALRRHVMDVAKYRQLKPWHGSWGTYARLDLPELLADEPWCVYADGDTLFLEDPLLLRGLFDPACAIQAHLDWNHSDEVRARHGEWFRQAGVAVDWNEYFCAGFAIVNLDLFRRNSVSRKCFDFLCAHPDAMYVDQDALYAACRGRIKLLPDEWGRFSYRAFADGRRGLLHYVADLPTRLMVSPYPAYNDAHALWFGAANRLYGLGWRDLVENPSWWGYWRRRVLGAVLAGLSRFRDRWPVRSVPALRDYLQRHYSRGCGFLRHCGQSNRPRHLDTAAKE